MSQKRKRSPERPIEGDIEQTSIFRSAPIEDRSSTFIGLYSPSLKPKDLQKLEEIAPASHKILAWRRESNQQSIKGGVKYTTDHDDDGEKYGGKKVAKVLENMNVTGACVVARWYGGVLLGPVRFEHIEKCASEAVKKWQEAVVEERQKKRKIEEEAAEKVKLVKVLADRDQSISVLRALAAEKEEKVKSAKVTSANINSAKGTSVKADFEQQNQDSGNSPTNGKDTPRPQPAATEAKPTLDYSTMTLDRLKALEKARDATLSFLLKRIDKAELELDAVDDEG
jgi:putative IMPACT (imprinted ancient) family translation regulator